jgi:hypothetical protein
LGRVSKTPSTIGDPFKYVIDRAAPSGWTLLGSSLLLPVEAFNSHLHTSTPPFPFELPLAAAGSVMQGEGILGVPYAKRIFFTDVKGC